MKIPVLGTFVEDSGFDALLESIDYPVEDLFVLNSGSDPINCSSNKKNHNVGRIFVSNIPGKITVGEAWNLIIKCYMKSPFWVIAKNSIALRPGLLGEMVKAFESDPKMGIVHGSKGHFGLGGWDVFLMTDKVVEALGLFDENVSPLGCEGADYFLRTVNNPIKKVFLESDFCFPATETDSLHLDYLVKKWGDFAALKTWANPFGDQNLPPSYFPYDLQIHRIPK